MLNVIKIFKCLSSASGWFGSLGALGRDANSNINCNAYADSVIACE